MKKIGRQIRTTYVGASGIKVYYLHINCKIYINQINFSIPYINTAYERSFEYDK